MAADFILIEDTAAANAKKRITMGSIDHDALANFVAAEHVDWAAASAGTIHTDNYIEGGAGTDTTAIHDNVAAEISVLTLVTAVAGDHILIEDASDSNNKKRIQVSDLLGATDADAIHDNVASEISAIAAKATPIAADFLLIEDTAAANAKKSITMGAIDHDALTNFVAAEHVDWAAASAGTIHTDNYIEGGAGTDTTAIHDNVASEISAITAKATPVAADHILIEDSAAANVKKRITMGAIDHDALTNFVTAEHVDWAAASAGTIHTDNYIEGGAGTDTTAIHDNVSGEIVTITEKVSPVGADVLLIEDSADSNNKKRVQITNLPGGGSGYDTIQDEGSALAQETTLDFVGAGVEATPGAGKTIVTIPGATGGGTGAAGVQARRTTAAPLTDGVFNDVTFDLTDVEHDAAILAHTPGGDDLTIGETTLYCVWYTVAGSQDTTTQAQARVRLNDTGTGIVAPTATPMQRLTIRYTTTN